MKYDILQRIEKLEAEIQELRTSLNEAENNETEFEQEVLTAKELRDNGVAHCPICYTFGHIHKKSCKFKNNGMNCHVKKLG